MTMILSTSSIAMVLSLIFYKTIHRYRYYLYAFTAVIALVIGTEEANIISMGYVPFGLFLVVMFSGVMDKGTIKKRLLMVRAELAVVASILLLPHVFVYLEYYLEDIGFFNGTFSFYFGLLAFLTMIPLTLTSFQFVRKPIGYKIWKKLHKFSYLFYFLIGLHLILMGNDRMWLYVIIFSTYGLLKIVSLLMINKKKSIKQTV